MYMHLKIELPEEEICVDSKDGDDSVVGLLYKCKKSTIILEHSLWTISKWEAKMHKAYLKEDYKMTTEEFLEYVKCMIIFPEDILEEDFIRLTRNPKYIKQINDYISDKMSASCFMESKSTGGRHGRSSDTMTSEVMYYSMFANQIPMELEHWHLNRLITLLRVFSVKNDVGSKKNRSMKDVMMDYDRINEMRKKKLGTRG